MLPGRTRISSLTHRTTAPGLRIPVALGAAGPVVDILLVLVRKADARPIPRDAMQQEIEGPQA